MVRITLCVAMAWLSAAIAGGQTFSRITTQTRFGAMHHVFAVVDLNADGLDDIVVGDMVEHDPEFTPADKRRKTRLRIFTSDGDGTFTHAPRLTSRQIRTHAAVVVAGDFNGDGRSDLAVYDAGAYVDSESSGYGNPPQLFLSGRGGVLRYSNSLANAVRREHRPDPPVPPPVALADLHLKMATTGDIDDDGDLDIWVESDGGNNMESHFAVNNGSGRFTLDSGNRATDLVHHNWPPTFWRYHEALFLDVDRDGDSDLVLGRLSVLDRRDRRDNPSIVLVNDGTGFFPARLELPNPAFSNGFSRVMGIARFDINRDGWDDIFMLHIRANDGPGGRSLHPGTSQHARREFRGRDPDLGTGPARHRDPRPELRRARDARRRPRRLPGSGGDRTTGQNPAAVASGLPLQPQRPILADVTETLRTGRPRLALRLGGDAHRRERRRSHRLRGVGTRSRAGWGLGNPGRPDMAGDPVEHDAPPGPPAVPERQRAGVKAISTASSVRPVHRRRYSRVR